MLKFKTLSSGLRRWSRNPEVVGSNPTGSQKLIFQILF